MKGKSTAAFGLALRAWNQGWPIGVFQFVKSAKWKVGEETALTALGDSGPGGTGRLAQDGRGLVLDPQAGDDEDHAADAPEGWAQIKRDLAAETYRLLRPRRVHLPDEVGLGRRRRGRSVLAARPGNQHVVITGRDADPRLVEAADLVTEMTKVKHPMDAGQKGQRGIEW